MGTRVFAVDEGYDVRVVEAFEDRYLGGQVLFEFLVELAEVDRLDGNDALNASIVGVNGFVDSSEASSADFFLSLESTNLVRLLGPPRGCGLRARGRHDGYPTSA